MCGAVDPTERRAKIVRLTDKGWEVVPIAEGAIARTEQQWLECVGPEHLDEARSVLEALLFDCSPEAQAQAVESSHVPSPSP